MADATGTTPEEWRLWRSFLAAQSRLSRRVDGQLQRDTDLLRGEYGALRAIIDAPDRRVRVGRIAEELGWERSRVSHLVVRMQQRGLVRREDCDGDGRGTELTVTPTGRRAYLTATRSHAVEIQEAFLHHVEPDERAVLQRVLDRIIASA